MQKIVPHLWFDKEAKEATAFYASLFPDSKAEHVTTIENTPSGDCDIFTFKLAGQDFMAINAGPHFKFNPAISMFAAFDSEKEIEATWNKLMQGGKALMGYDTYPWAKKYGWLEDKYGLSWQLSWGEQQKAEQKITPFLMFTQHLAGKAKEAMETYVSIFPNSKIDLMLPYEKSEGEKEGAIKHGRFTLCGQKFMAMDSSHPHGFIFNEAISLMVNCDTQKEIDYYWEKLSAVPDSEQCGWIKDRFGVSWQITSGAMSEMMRKGTKEQVDRLTQAFLKMKKFDLAELKKVFEK